MDKRILHGVAAGESLQAWHISIIIEAVHHGWRPPIHPSLFAPLGPFAKDLNTAMVYLAEKFPDEYEIQWEARPVRSSEIRYFGYG